MFPTSFNNIQGGSLTPLPVELTVFTVSMGASAALLTWKTATEMNNYGFEVERSYDERAWSTVNFVAGHGTSNSPRTYRYADPVQPEFGRHARVYYRLRQVDRDGSAEYLPVVSVSTTPSSRRELSRHYPNPIDVSMSGDATARIAFMLPSREQVSLAVYDALGREVRRLYDNTLLDAGSYVAVFDAGGLPAGRYTYRLTHAGGVESRSMYLIR